MGGRSAFVRCMWRISRNRMTSSPSISPNFMLRRTPVSPTCSSSSSRWLPRQLSSLLPFHSAIASACLVSKLPAEPTTSIEGRFANYLSPI